MMSKYIKIDDLRLHLQNLVLDGERLDPKTTRLIIMTLRELPIHEFDAESATTTDCISRKQAVEAVTNTIREKFSLADWYEQLVETGLEIENLIKELPPVTPTERIGWIPVSERLPECEQEVLICTEKKVVGKDAYIDTIITPAIYEDGTMLEVDSIWNWEDIEYAGWDEKEDCGIIPEGWWENRHFSPDEVYNNPVDRKVIAWQPLPEPYKGGDDNE